MTLLLGFAAVNTGNNLLFMIVSALLGFMAVTGFFGWGNIRSLEMSVVLPEEVYAGRETVIIVRLRNHKRRLPSFLLRLSVIGATGRTRILPSRAETAISVPVTFARRGNTPIGTCVVSSPYPVNFFVRRAEAEVALELTVFPAPVPTGYPERSAETGQTGFSLSRGSGYEGELSKILDYTGKDPLKNIHWRLSAKHRELKVKHLSAMTAEPVIIDPALVPGANLEERLSRSAYLVNRLMGQHRPVGLKAGSKVIPPALDDRNHRLKLLRELALYVQD